MLLSQAAWSRIERGESAIGIDQICQASEIFGLKPSEFISKVDDTVARLTQQGIEVSRGRALPQNFDKIVLIGAAALGLLIGRLITK